MKNLKPMKSFALLLICFFSLPLAFASHRAQAENEGQPVLNKPLKYVHPVELAEPLVVDGRTYYYESPAPGDELDMRRYWYVWSDRQDNPSYTTFDGATEQEQLGFLQPLAVLELRGNRLRVACKNDIKFNRGIAILPAGKTDLGWVDHANLLLWNRSLTCEKYRLPIKDKVLYGTKSENDAAIRGDLFLDAPPGAEAMLQSTFGFCSAAGYFLFKKTDDGQLLGNRLWINSRDATNAKDVINGWVNKNHGVRWITRLALEVDWEQAGKRAEKGEAVVIWANRQDAKDFKKQDSTGVNQQKATEFNNHGEIVYTEDPFYRRRMQGLFNRFYLFDVDDGIAHVGFYEPIGDRTQECIVWEKQENMRLAEGLRNINIVFVIDASYSMEMYSEPVAHALARAMQTIYEREWHREPHRQKIYRFGALVFRDEPEQHIIHYSNWGQLTQDTEMINTFLKDKLDPMYNVRSRDLPGSMFYGIEQAMQIFEPKPEQTNYTIIIGGAGDHQNPHDKPRTYRTAEQVVNELSAVNSNVIACQVFHNQRISPITGQMLQADTIYETFQTQLKHIMKETAKRIKGDDAQLEHDNIRWAETAANTFALQNAPIAGELIVPPANDFLEVRHFEKVLRERIEAIDSIQNSLIDQLMDEVRAVPVAFREGYTVFDNSDNAWFQLVALVTYSFLSEVERNLRQISDIRRLPPIQRRKALIRVCDNMITAFLGEIDRENVRDITLDQIISRIIEVHADPLWCICTREFLIPPRIVVNQDFYAYAAAYTALQPHVRRIVEMGSDYEGFIIGSDNLLWVPVKSFYPVVSF